MIEEHAFYLVLTLAGAAIALLGLIVRRAPRVFAVATLAALAIPLIAAWVNGPSAVSDSGHRSLALVAGVLAVAGGGLVTTQVLSLVDGGERLRRAGDVLRGGAWIGSLERLAVYATLLVGWGPGLAIVLAVKGLGRYPELRSQEDTGVAERFIIGTFSSVLFAAGCAGLAVLAP